jgi:hypothetical protein
VGEGEGEGDAMAKKRKGGNHGKRGQETTKEDEKTQTQKAIGPGSS